MTRTFAAWGAALAFCAVALGAFGAHLLHGWLDDPSLVIYQTSVQYHFIHAVALLLVAALAPHFRTQRLLKYSGWLFVIGVVIFSGSLYALAITGVTKLGAITPIGGLCFLFGWGCLVLAALKEQRPEGK